MCRDFSPVSETEVRCSSERRSSSVACRGRGQRPRSEECSRGILTRRLNSWKIRTSALVDHYRRALKEQAGFFAVPRRMDGLSRVIQGIICSSWLEELMLLSLMPNGMKLPLKTLTLLWSHSNYATKQKRGIGTESEEAVKFGLNLKMPGIVICPNTE